MKHKERFTIQDIITAKDEAVLLDLLSRHQTPTEAIRKALRADSCELKLTFGDKTVVVRDVNWRK